jgi:hypothetical protein
MTSVSERVRNVYDAPSFSRSSTWLKISPLKTMVMPVAGSDIGWWPDAMSTMERRA